MAYARTFRRNTKVRTVRKRKVPVARKRVTTKKAITSVVKKTMFANQEKKMAIKEQTALNFNGAISSLSELYNLYPAIAEGTSENQRIGNQVRAKYLTVRGHIMIAPSVYDNILPASVTLGTPPLLGVPPMYVEIFILRNKIKKQYGDITAAADLQLLDFGSNYSQYDGKVNCLYTPVNKDRYQTVMRKRIKLSAPYLSAATTTGNVANPMEGRNVLVSLFSKNIKLNKVLKYAEDDSVGLYPQNDNLVMCLGYVNPITGEVDNAFETKITAQWVTQLHFTEY